MEQSPAPVDEKAQLARTNEVLSEYAAAVKQVSVDTDSHFIDLFPKLLSLDDYPQIIKGIRNDGRHK